MRSAPLPTPESLFEEGRAPTFGVVRELALKFAVESRAETNFWGTKLFVSILKNDAVARALESVNIQRNNLAHGKKSLPLTEIKKLVVKSLQLDAWAQISEVDGELQLADWLPWIEVASATTGQIGLFERWQKNAIRYLVPETGEVFKLPRKSTAPNN
jgi:hypothetical protein